LNTPEGDCDFLPRLFADRYQRKAQLLREDFCGTAGLACEWVGRGEDQYVVGIDWDQLTTLDWCKQQHISKLDPAAQERLTLQPRDVRNGNPWKVDVTAAHNFSWMMFRDRSKLRDSFKKCQVALKKNGVLC
jgi:hypothetical protein